MNLHRIDSPELYVKLTNPTATTGDMKSVDPRVAANTMKGKNGRHFMVHSESANIVLTRTDGTDVTFATGELPTGVFLPFIFTHIVCTAGVITVAWD